jgi:hypothetical protein
LRENFHLRAHYANVNICNPRVGNVTYWRWALPHLQKNFLQPSGWKRAKANELLSRGLVWRMYSRAVSKKLPAEKPKKGEKRREKATETVQPRSALQYTPHPSAKAHDRPRKMSPRPDGGLGAAKSDSNVKKQRFAPATGRKARTQSVRLPFIFPTTRPSRQERFAQ